jgi:nucleoid DNA-binding protein
LYKTVKKTNPRDPQAPAKYHIQSKSRGFIDIEHLLDAICEDNTLNRDEARMAINRTFKKAVDYVRLGFNVGLGPLGHVEVSIRSKGVDTEAEVSATNVTDVVPHFIFGTDLRDSIKKEKLERAAD